jgi:hypothetical protein
MFSIKKVSALLLLAFVAKTLCATFCVKIPALGELSTVVYFVSGIAIALLATPLAQA